MNKRGMSLAIASAIMVIIFSLSMVSLSMVLSNANTTRSIYQQTVVTNRAVDAPGEATVVLSPDAVNGFQTVLDTEGDFYTGNITYDLFGDVTAGVSIRDNNDLDDDLGSDTDKIFILTARGYIIDDPSVDADLQTNISEATLEVLVRYTGNEDEYAQETGSAKSSSNFSSEIEMSDF